MMNRYFHKPFRWAAVFSIFMALAVTFVLLDAFVIPRPETAIYANTVTTSASVSKTRTTAATVNAAANLGSSTAASGNLLSSTGSTPVITDTSYKDDNISITIETVRKYDTDIYIADIQVSDVSYLKTAFANGTYGRNIKATTSSMAETSNAIFAINGDYYGFRDYGFVLRNGILYRTTAREAGNDAALAIDNSGNFSIISESDTDAQTLNAKNIWQVLSFGPALVNDGQITVTASSEVGQSKSSNPRTAIGQISPLHYIVIVSDGRTSESAGLSLLELAQEFADRGCTVAYNLDGGGSSTMWFNGQVINNPTDGKSNSERSVSDIVYLGY